MIDISVGSRIKLIEMRSSLENSQVSFLPWDALWADDRCPMTKVCNNACQGGHVRLKVRLLPSHRGKDEVLATIA
jgi:hypothetical protein